MKKYTCLYLLLALFVVCVPDLFAQNISGKSGPALVIHGGAGNIDPTNINAKRVEKYHNKLKEVLNEGYRMLGQGKSAEEVVVHVIAMMEDSELFNAGKGAVFTHKEENELDASIMNGMTGQAGAVAGVKTIKNPIKAAQAVMNDSDHVMLSGAGAEEFADSAHLVIVDPSYFATQRRLESIKKIKQKELGNTEGNSGSWEDYKYGTVGAVALDKAGNLCAGTSTGGMTNKKYGRIGDSPIIGAGTYADNASCAISATGHGEFFIRNVVAYDISALMKYKNLSIGDAANEVIVNKLVPLGGEGGVIGMDAKGNITMTFNTSGMFRGYINKPYRPNTFVFK